MLYYCAFALVKKICSCEVPETSPASPPPPQKKSQLKKHRSLCSLKGAAVFLGRPGTFYTYLRK